MRGDGGDYTTQLQAALTAANVAGGNTSVELPPGIVGVGSSFSLAGKSSGLRGAGASYADSAVAGTVLKATGQSGPVLDLTGWQMPANFRGKVQFSDFTVQGDGTAGSAKSGICIPGAFGGIALERVAVMNTGGPCLDLGTVYLSELRDLVLCQPVNAESGDIPYLRGRGANGNLLEHIGFMAFAAAESCGVSGVIDWADNGTYSSHDNEFLVPWFENIHVPTNGSIIQVRGNANWITDPQFFDCKKKEGATGTKFVTFAPSAVSDYGGNTMRGRIPGRSGTASDIDYGVDLAQSRNRIEGVKGYNGYNARVGSGVGNSAIYLGGAGSTATNPAVEDNSGVATNVIVDDYLRTGRRGSYAYEERTSAQGGAGPRFYDPSTPANGALHLGQSGTRLQVAGTDAYLAAARLFLRHTDSGNPIYYFGGGTSAPSLRTGTGSPEGVVTAAPGSIYLRTDGGAATSLYVKESGTGATGWAAK